MFVHQKQYIKLALGVILRRQQAQAAQLRGGFVVWDHASE